MIGHGDSPAITVFLLTVGARGSAQRETILLQGRHDLACGQGSKLRVVQHYAPTLLTPRKMSKMPGPSFPIS